MIRYRMIAVIVRAIIPIGILAAGGYAFCVLSVEPEEAKSPPLAEQVIRTRVTRLRAAEYTVVIKTHGVVQPHNSVTLSAEVSGRITSISSAFEVGAYFSEGDVLVELDDRDYRTALTVARAQHKMAESARQLAANSHRRMAELSRTNAVTESEMEEAAATLAKTTAEVDTAAAQIEQAQRDLERTKIRATFDGRVQTKLVGVGRQVAPGTALGDVFAVEFAEVRLPLAGRELRFLDLPEMNGDPPVEVELRDAIDETSDAVWKAKIVRTEGALDEDSLELFAIARVDDPFSLHSNHPVLRIRQPVVATIRGATLEDVVAMPRGAVRQLDQVFLVDENELTLKAMTIQPVWSDEEHVIVRDTLIHDGALLATTQLVYAPEGAGVEIIADAEIVDPNSTALASE